MTALTNSWMLKMTTSVISKQVAILSPALIPCSVVVHYLSQATYSQLNQLHLVHLIHSPCHHNLQSNSLFSNLHSNQWHLNNFRHRVLSNSQDSWEHQQVLTLWNRCTTRTLPPLMQTLTTNMQLCPIRVWVLASAHKWRNRDSSNNNFINSNNLRILSLVWAKDNPCSKQQAHLEVKITPWVDRILVLAHPAVDSEHLRRVHFHLHLLSSQVTHIQDQHLGLLICRTRQLQV